jgi:hypothetical protein
VATAAPTRADIAQVAWSTCLRVVEMLKARGLAFDAQPEDTDALTTNEPLLAECAAASMQDVVILGPRRGKRVLRLAGGPNQTEPKTQRPAHGFDVHAARRIAAHDRRGLERLCNYILRPPFSNERLTLLPDGRVRLKLKRPWSDGTAYLIHDATDFIARLVPLIPLPGTHQVRYHGFLSSASKLRSKIVPAPPRRADDDPVQLELLDARGPEAQLRLRRIRWAKLMARVWGFDPLLCPACERPMRIVAFVTKPDAIAHILAHDPITPPRPGPHGPRAPPQLELPFATQSADAAA